MQSIMPSEATSDLHAPQSRVMRCLLRELLLIQTDTTKVILDRCRLQTLLYVYIHVYRYIRAYVVNSLYPGCQQEMMMTTVLKSG